LWLLSIIWLLSGRPFETTLLIDYHIVVMNGQKYSMTFDQVGFPSDNIWRVNTGGRC
jgi:hypothetical protein